MKLTVKQQELVDLIKSKQEEIGKKLYVRYGGIFGLCLVKIISDTKCEIVERGINSKVADALLNKGILIEEKVNEQLTMITLNLNNI